MRKVFAKWQPPAVSSFFWNAMTSGCTWKNCFWSCDLNKGRRSSFTMWKNFPCLRYMWANMWAAAAAVGRISWNQISVPDGPLNYECKRISVSIQRSSPTAVNQTVGHNFNPMILTIYTRHERKFCEYLAILNVNKSKNDISTDNLFKGVSIIKYTN